MCTNNNVIDPYYGPRAEENISIFIYYRKNIDYRTGTKIRVSFVCNHIVFTHLAAMTKIRVFKITVVSTIPF
jgi:hypothetical protein